MNDARALRPALFREETFVGHSGDTLQWKIECDALTVDDWRCLALMAVSLVPPFQRAVGIPRGGIPFADALNRHASPDANDWLLVDDVWTTGGSMLDALADTEDEPICLVAFNRGGLLPPWCSAVISVNPGVAK